MRVETFLENFDLLAEIPNAVPKLRELILELALKGRLTEQDPEDAQAEEILPTLSQAGSKMIPQDGCYPYSIPAGWRLTVVKGLGTTSTGVTPRTSDIESFGTDYPFVRPGDIFPDRIEYRKQGLSQRGFELSGRAASPGSILMVCIGTIGKVNVADRPCAFNQQINALAPFAGVDPKLLTYFLRSPYFQTEARRRASSTTIAILNKGKWESIPLPLPPIAEQRRIVAKVDQLMALCDELERRQQARREGRERLCTTALNALTSAVDAEEVAVQWEPIRDNFGVMFNEPRSIRALRQTIQKLAVRGRLVRSSEHEEPANALFQRTAEALGRKSTVDPRSKGRHAEYPWPVPPSWVWGSLGHITICRDGERIPVSRELRAQRVGPFDYYGASGVIDKIDGFLFEKPLLLVGEDGANLINRSTPIAFIARGKYWVNNHAHVLDAVEEDMLPYLALFINATDLREYITGTAQPKMNQAKMNSIKVAVPPLAEQRRIVAKVDELMALCDDLESKLSRSEEVGTQLLDAVVRAISGAASGMITVSNGDRHSEDNGSVESGNGSIHGNGNPEPPLRRTPGKRAPSRNGSVQHVASSLPRSAAEPARPHRVDTGQRGLVTETETDASSERPPSIEEIPVEEVMSAFRHASRGAGRLSEDDLLRETALELGYRRLGPKIRERLKGHLRAAIRRRIIARDGDVLNCAMPTIASCDYDVLLRAMGSVMKKNREYEAGEIIDMVAEHLGFARVTAAMRERIGEAIRAGRKAGVLGTKGKWVWREE